jgi:BON domain
MPSVSPAAGPAVEAPAATRPAFVEAAPVAGPVASDSDARIQNEIQRLLTSSSTLRTQPIVVEVANGIVTLSGSVGDTVSSQLAESFAASVAGVRRVFNTLRVPAADATTAAGEAPPAQLPRPPADEERESPRQLVEKAKREMAAGNLPGAMAACQAVLRIEPANPMARECVQRLEGRLGGPPRRR